MIHTATSSTAIDDSSTHEVPQPRVHDNGRALWVVTAVVLAAGLGALRLVLDVSDTPRVDPNVPNEAAQHAPAVTPVHDDVHKLRPQTSSEPGTLQPLSGAPMLQDQWPSVPAANWEPSTTPSFEPDVAQHPEFLR